MTRFILALVLVGALAASAFASAATLGVSGGAIQSGSDATLYCDTNGVKVAGWGLETDTDTVSAVRIADIDAACVGNALFVKVYDGTGAVIAEGKVDPVAAAEARISLNNSVDPELIEKITVWIEGDKP